MAKKEENLEEESAMGNGAIEGSSCALGKRNQRSPTLFREEDDEDEEDDEQKQFIEEMILRQIVYEALKKRHYKNLNEAKRLQEAKKNDEHQFRQVVRALIQEAKKDMEVTPHSSTAINILEDLLKQILPNLETEYKTLTTSKEQRDSFRAHIVSAVSTLLETEDINKEGGLAGTEEEILSLDEQDGDIEEEVDIKVSDVDATPEDKFIDIEEKPEQEPEEVDTFGIEGQDETGKAMAQEAFNNIEKNCKDCGNKYLNKTKDTTITLKQHRHQRISFI